MKTENNLLKAAVAAAMVVSLAPFMKPNVALAYDAVQNGQNINYQSQESTEQTDDSSQLIQQSSNDPQNDAEKKSTGTSENETNDTEKEAQTQQSNMQQSIQNEEKTDAAAQNETDAETVAKIGDTNYSSLKKAVDDAKDGDTVLVTKSIKVSEEVKVVNKTITLKGVGNGVTLYRADNYLDGYLLNIDANSAVNIENINYDGGASGFKLGAEIVKNKQGHLPMVLVATDLKATKSMVYSEGKLIAKNSSFKNALIVTDKNDDKKVQLFI